MGLSDEERIQGLFYSINSIVKLADNIKDSVSYEYEYPKKLIHIINELWHSFIGKEHDSCHWLFGSSSANEVRWDTCSAWAVAAVNHHCNDIFEKKEEKEDIFDAFEHFLDIKGLLECRDIFYKKIYEIYQWTEQAIYYLRRYNDRLLKNYNNLSKLLSDIQGECFDIFKKHDVFARAYILNTLCKFLYGTRYPYQKEKWDSFTKFLSESASHHDLNRLMEDGELKDLADIHVKLQKAKKSGKLTIMLKAETFLILSGRKFHYDHLFKRMITILKLNKVDILKLKSLFDKNKLDHEEDEKKSMKNYRDNKLSLLSIYGLNIEEGKD